MKPLKYQVEKYIQFRRQLGYKLENAEKILKNFASFSAEHGVSYIKIDVAVSFSKKNPKASPATWSKSLGIIRQFALFLKTIDQRTEVPPLNFIASSNQRPIPYIYTNEQIQHLLKACKKLGSRSEILKHTYYTLFGLVSVTGMRISEAISLEQKNVDFSNEIVFINKTKFRKSRINPLHSSTLYELEKYIDYKSKLFPKSESSNLFVSSAGSGLKYHNVRKAFVQASIFAGLRSGYKGHGPRIHDLRHTFAVQTLTEWYKNSTNIDVHLPLLSTYLGHINPVNTYWYLTATPDLLNQAVVRLEKNMGGII